MRARAARPRARWRWPALAGLVAVVLAVALAGMDRMPWRALDGAAPDGSPGVPSTSAGRPGSGAPTSPPGTATPDPAATAPLPTVGRPLDPDGYLVSRRELLDRVRLARAGVEPHREALEDLLRWARRAVGTRPEPATTLRIDGTTGPFVNDSARAYGLALAAVAADDRAYARAAAAHIRAWATGNARAENACPDSGACQTSLVMSRAAPGFVFAAALLPADVLDAETDRVFRDWLRQVVLPAASRRDNNWGDAGTFARVVITDYLGDRAGFDAAIARWRALLDLVQANGEIPAESARGDAGVMYTQEALDYKVAVAVIAERRGVDLWDEVGAGGGSLRAIADLLARAWRDRRSWPGDDRVEIPAPSDVWELLYARWPDPRYAEILLERRPYGWSGHSAVRWATLAQGLPVAVPATG